MSEIEPPQRNLKWKADQDELTFVRDHSGLKPKEIQTRMGLTNNVQYYNVLNGKGGFRPSKRGALRRMTNETRKRLHMELLPEEQVLDLDQGTPFNLTSKELEFTLIKQVISKHEKRWVVEITLNQAGIAQLDDDGLPVLSSGT